MKTVIIGLIMAGIAFVGLIVIFIVQATEKEYNHGTRVLQIIFQILGIIATILVAIGKSQL